MDSLANEYKAGLISRHAYWKVAMDKTIGILNSTPLQYVKTLGEGSYGSVVEVKCTEPHVKMAAKIVLKDRILENELLVWPTLDHPNILRLITQMYLPNAHTHIFFMRMHPTSLELKLDDSFFLSDPNGFGKSLSWLNDILSGVSYLHRRGLCHLDLKCDNVLISEEDTAIVCDFGFVTSAVEGPVDSYGSPFIYRPPEAKANMCSLTEVDGFKFDMWTLGTLAVELFTRQSIYCTANKTQAELKDWASDMYPMLFAILQERKFANLMQNAFPTSESIKSGKDRKTASFIVTNFIRACLDLNPANRLSAEEAADHLLFEGGRLFPHDSKSIWSKKASLFEVNMLLQFFAGREEVKSCQTTSSAVVTVESGDSSSSDTSISVGGKSTYIVVNKEPMKKKENIDVERAKTVLTARPESVSPVKQSLSDDDDIEPGEIILDDEGNYSAGVNLSQDVQDVYYPADVDSERSSNGGAKGTVTVVECTSLAEENSETEEIIENICKVKVTRSRRQKLSDWAKKKKLALRRVFKCFLPPFRCR